MSREVWKAFSDRRSFYAVSGESPADDARLREIVEFTAMNAPSAFNSQSARLVLLLGGEHRRHWEMVREALRRAAGDKFADASRKIDSFAAGKGTILFFEDMATLERLQKDHPAYAASFPEWAMHAAGMNQLMAWVLLRDSGLGASLQHYGNLVEGAVKAAWGIDAGWRLLAQMPFGKIQAEPGPKTSIPLVERVKVFG